MHANTQVLWIGGTVKPGRINEWTWDASDQEFELYTNWKDGDSSKADSQVYTIVSIISGLLTVLYLYKYFK